MSNLKQLNNNFIDLLSMDLEAVKKKFEEELVLTSEQTEVKSNGTLLNKEQTLVFDNDTLSNKEQINVSTNGIVSEIDHDQTCTNSNASVYKKTNPRVKHSEILKILLNNIDEVDFREEAGVVEESEKLKYKDFLVTCSDKVLEAAQASGLGICNSRDNAYLYNGEYWKRLSNHKFYTFLGESATKMGINKNTSKHYSFKEQLMKQLLSVADMYDDADFDDCDDNDKILINLLNGTFEIDGSDMRLRKPDKDDFLTYQLPFKYDENAECPIFDNYLNTVLPDINNQKVLMEYLGYLFVRTNALKLEKSLILYGTGANGKSVLFEILNALLGGSNNVSNYSLQNLTNENGYYRAMLGNKLVNYASEINGKMDVSIFKQLVSGEPVDARLPYGEPFTITNYGKLIFNCNRLPASVEQTHAFFRRFLIIPFDVTIPEEEQDKQLAEKIIKSELSGVLNRVLEGLKRILRQKNFTQSESANALLSNYKKESDTVAMYVEEMGYESGEEYVLASTLFEEYKSYCFQCGYNPVGKHSFNQRLKNSGIIIERQNVGMVAYVRKNKFEKNSSQTSQTSPESMIVDRN